MALTLNVTHQFSDFPTITKDLVEQLRSQKQWVVNPRRKNGVIIYKPYHGEFAGPGAVIGGIFDLDVVNLLPVGKLSLIEVHSSEERQRSYLIRRQWIKLLTKILDNPDPTQRAQVILNQFEHWFDSTTASQLSNEAFASLIGVLPQTIAQVRNSSDRPDIF